MKGKEWKERANAERAKHTSIGQLQATHRIGNEFKMLNKLFNILNILSKKNSKEFYKLKK
jgi:hypothetical protein